MHNFQIITFCRFICYL